VTPRIFRGVFFVWVTIQLSSLLLSIASPARRFFLTTRFKKKPKTPSSIALFLLILFIHGLSSTRYATHPDKISGQDPCIAFIRVVDVLMDFESDYAIDFSCVGNIRKHKVFIFILGLLSLNGLTYFF
jgi:hypothetical protein